MGQCVRTGVRLSSSPPKQKEQFKLLLFFYQKSMHTSILDSFEDIHYLIQKAFKLHIIAYLVISFRMGCRQSADKMTRCRQIFGMPLQTIFC